MFASWTISTQVHRGASESRNTKRKKRKNKNTEKVLTRKITTVLLVEQIDPPAGLVFASPTNMSAGTPGVIVSDRKRSGEIRR